MPWQIWATVELLVVLLLYLLVKPHLAHFMLQLRQIAFLQSLTLTPSSNSYNAFRMKFMDSFQKLIQRVVCVTNNENWTIPRVITIVSIPFPLPLVMQQYISNLQEKSSHMFVRFCRYTNYLITAREGFIVKFQTERWNFCFMDRASKRGP